MRRLVPRITTARAEDPAESFLMPLRISSAEIRLLMRQVLGHALSSRTLQRLARSTGGRLKRGRPPTTPRVSELQDSRVARVSCGLGFLKAAIGATKRLAQEILEKGTVAAMKEGMQTPEISALVARKAGS